VALKVLIRPTSEGLARFERERRLLESLGREQGTTIVMVTHDQDKADRTGRILRLFDGRLVH
jgi:predicted ABC-type transport system involved in lysophospholipase L1 biosynthesis ATPase subunit